MKLRDLIPMDEVKSCSKRAEFDEFENLPHRDSSQLIHKLKAFRKGHGLSQEEMAAILGMGYSSYRRAEQGQANKKSKGDKVYPELPASAFVRFLFYCQHQGIWFHVSDFFEEKQEYSEAAQKEKQLVAMRLLKDQCALRFNSMRTRTSKALWKKFVGKFIMWSEYVNLPEYDENKNQWVAGTDFLEKAHFDLDMFLRFATETDSEMIVLSESERNRLFRSRKINMKQHLEQIGRLIDETPKEEWWYWERFYELDSD